MNDFKHYTIADEDMPEKCPESCIYKRFSRNMANAAKHDAAIIAKAREEVLDDYEKELWIELQSCGVSREVANGIFLNIRSKLTRRQPEAQR